MTPTPADFLHLLEDVLRQRRLPFSRGAAIAFVESCWKLIEDNPDPWHWSTCFVETGAVAVEERRSPAQRHPAAGEFCSYEETFHRVTIYSLCRVATEGRRVEVLLQLGKFPS